MTASNVRKSSLLRFAQNAESDSGESAGIPDVDPSGFPEPPNALSKTYRARSQTYAWIQSEADSEDVTGSPPVDQMSALSIQSSPPLLRAEARTFISRDLPPPFGSCPRTSSVYSLPVRSRDATPQSAATSSSDRRILIQPSNEAITPRVPPSTPPRRSSLAYQLLSSNSNSPASSVQLPEAPVTPTRPSQPRTVPRTYHGHGGPPLRIYDDRVSPTGQPQTPADLSRQLGPTHHDAAYTAPPGIMGRRGRAVSNTSPAVRARDLHTRWTREYRRGFQVEHEQRNGQRPGRALWRDELDFDRVGEENE